MLFRGGEKAKIYYEGRTQGLLPDVKLDNKFLSKLQPRDAGPDWCDLPEVEFDEEEGSITMPVSEENLGQPELAVVSCQEMGSSRGNKRKGDELTPGVNKYNRALNVQLLDKILNAYKKFVFSPPSALIVSPHWIHDPVLRGISVKCEEFITASSYWQSNLRHMNYSQFKEFYSAEEGRYCIWRDKPYHTPENSVNLAWKWLKEQASYGTLRACDNNSFEDRKISAKQLLQLIVDIAEKRLSKTNAFHFYGGFNCGKTWFLNMLADFYINVGYHINWNRYNMSFRYDDVVNRRLAIWNEPNLNGDSQQWEELKTLFEGEILAADVKHQRKFALHRTPTFITSNKPVYNDDPAFGSRKIQFNCIRPSWIVGGPECPAFMPLHPFAYIHLIENLKIDTLPFQETAKLEVASVLTSCKPIQVQLT